MANRNQNDIDAVHDTSTSYKDYMGPILSKDEVSIDGGDEFNVINDKNKEINREGKS